MSEPVSHSLAVSVDKGQLCGGTEGLDSLLRVGDLRDLDRYTVVAGQGDGRLGEALCRSGADG